MTRDDREDREWDRASSWYDNWKDEQMTEQDFNRRLQEFADEMGLEFDTPSPLDKIWDCCVGFAASLGFIVAVVGLLALCTWMDK